FLLVLVVVYRVKASLPRRHECARVSGCVLVIGDRALSEMSCQKCKKPVVFASGFLFNPP
ncbi:hypothetical protein MJM25_26365, partial [Salmonella enterica subsp. enterica serovar Lubbock]|nr:hypothetical protein [Salmonella enterica subsp. enterica serovar Lubbock]